ncbi:MAG: hypothetical protein MdMp014T_2949 [Treponematales bacterium]
MLSQQETLRNSQDSLASTKAELMELSQGYKRLSEKSARLMTDMSALQDSYNSTLTRLTLLSRKISDYETQVERLKAALWKVGVSEALVGLALASLLAFMVYAKLKPGTQWG